MSKSRYNLFDRDTLTLDIDLCRDLSYPTGWEMVKDTAKYAMNFKAPDVELHCLYGTKVATVESLNYKKSQTVDGTPELIMGDGDGTVNYRSLAACNQWNALQKAPISTVELQGVDHMGVLTNDQVIKYILDIMIK